MEPNSKGVLGRVSRRVAASWQQLQIYAYYTGKPHCINPITYMRRLRDHHAESELRRHDELWAFLIQMRAASKSTGADWSDYWMLYRAIVDHKFHCVLECGSGITTCVIAVALKEVKRETGRDVVCISMEEHPGYYQDVIKAFPKELADVVQFHCSDRVESNYDGLRGCHYKDVPDMPYQFVFIDGPTPRRAPGSTKCFNADYINMLARCDGELAGMIDQRIFTLWAYQALLPEADLTYDVTRRLTHIKATRAALPSSLAAALRP